MEVAEFVTRQVFHQGAAAGFVLQGHPNRVQNGLRIEAGAPEKDGLWAELVQQGGKQGVFARVAALQQRVEQISVHTDSKE